MAKSDVWTPSSEAKCGFWDIMRRSLLLAEYLFSFLVLFAFFKQPSHAKLQRKWGESEKEAPSKNGSREGVATTEVCNSPRRPDSFIVQDTYLVHPAPTVHTFNKPDKEEKWKCSLETNFLIKRKKTMHSVQWSHALTVQGPVCHSSSSQTDPCLLTWREQQGKTQCWSRHQSQEHVALL